MQLEPEVLCDMKGQNLRYHWYVLNYNTDTLLWRKPLYQRNPLKAYVKTCTNSAHYITTLLTLIDWFVT